jgi:hypothetical protein
MRIHRDTCSAIKLVISANTTMGIKYKVGESRLTLDSLTSGEQMGSILLPIHRILKDEIVSSVIGEMHLDITRQPFPIINQDFRE